MEINGKKSGICKFLSSWVVKQDGMGFLLLLVLVGAAHYIYSLAHLQSAAYMECTLQVTGGQHLHSINAKDLKIRYRPIWKFFLVGCHFRNGGPNNSVEGSFQTYDI